jgi:hypothetical protein
MLRTLALAALAATLSPLLAVSNAQQTGQEQMTVQLEPIGTSTVSGTVTLRPDRDDDDDGTEFIITLSARDDADRGREYELVLIAGTCDKPGRVVEEIEDDLNANGRPEEEDEDIPLSVLRSSDHALQVRHDDDGPVVACGVIPR